MKRRSTLSARSALLGSTVAVASGILASLAVAHARLATGPCESRLPATRVSSRVEVRELGRLGLSVRWPHEARAGSLCPGSVVQIDVENRGRRGDRRRVQLTLAHVVGRRLVALAERTVFSGTVIFALPRTPGQTYALSLQAGRYAYRSRLTTGAAVPGNATAPGVTYPSMTTGSQTSPSMTSPLTHMATLTLSTTSVPAGASLTYTVTNTGTGNIEYSDDYGWQELVSGSWVDVPTGDAFDAASHALRPGATTTGEADAYTRSGPQGQTETPFDPGQYRVVKPTSVGDLTAEVQVTATPPATTTTQSTSTTATTP